MKIMLAFVSLCLLGAPVGAQEVVHAQTGKVVEVSAARKTLTLKLGDGTTVTYQDVPSHEPDLSLDSRCGKRWFRWRRSPRWARTWWCCTLGTTHRRRWL
jgi:hypothetical protein